MTSISLVEDDREIRQALQFRFDSAPGFFCLGAYADGESALSELPANLPDVLLMDIELPGLSGIECVRRLANDHPNLNILMLTVHDEDELVFQSLCAGACGYLTKNTEPERLLAAIGDANNGGAPMSTKIARLVVNSFRHPAPATLTARETEVLTFLCRGHSYKMLADDLFISEDTVRSHIKHIYRKLQVNSKSEAVARALRERLV